MIGLVLVFIFAALSPLERTGDFFYERGDYWKADLAYTQALRDADSDRDRWRLLRKHAICCFRMGDYRRAREALECIPRPLRGQDDEILLSILQSFNSDLLRLLRGMEDKTFRPLPPAPFRLSRPIRGTSLRAAGEPDRLTLTATWGDGEIEVALKGSLPIRLSSLNTIEADLDRLYIIPSFKLGFFNELVIGYSDGPFLTLWKEWKQIEIGYSFRLPPLDELLGEATLKDATHQLWARWTRKPFLASTLIGFTGAEPREIGVGIGLWGGGIMGALRATGLYPIESLRDLRVTALISFWK